MPRDDCVWSAEQIAAASRAANAPRSEERVWEGKGIVWWSEWVTRNRREAVLILEDGTRYVIQERVQGAEEEASPPNSHRSPRAVE
jgi:hypothetical protein